MHLPGAGRHRHPPADDRRRTATTPSPPSGSPGTATSCCRHRTPTSCCERLRPAATAAAVAGGARSGFGSGRPVTRVRVAGLTEAGRVALADLLGLDRLPGPVTEVTPRPAGRGGPPRQRSGAARPGDGAGRPGREPGRAAEADRRRRRSRALDLAGAASDRPGRAVLLDWAAQLRRAGLVDGSPELTRAALERALAVLDALPGDGQPAAGPGRSRRSATRTLWTRAPACRPGAAGAGLPARLPYDHADPPRAVGAVGRRLRRAVVDRPGRRPVGPARRPVSAGHCPAVRPTGQAAASPWSRSGSRRRPDPVRGRRLGGGEPERPGARRRPVRARAARRWCASRAGPAPPGCCCCAPERAAAPGSTTTVISTATACGSPLTCWPRPAPGRGGWASMTTGRRCGPSCPARRSGRVTAAPWDADLALAMQAGTAVTEESVAEVLLAELAEVSRGRPSAPAPSGSVPG